MSDTNTRNANESVYNTFMALTEGDEFTTSGGNWIVESVEDEPRYSARVLTAARKGAEHEWARFTANSAALTVTAAIHDEFHERFPEANDHVVNSLTTPEGENPGADVDSDVSPADLSELDTGAELTFHVNHTTSGQVRELTGTVASHPYMDAHEDWMVVLEDVTRFETIRVAGNGPGKDGCVVIYRDGTVESRPNASRQIELGDLRAVVTSDTEDSESVDREVMTDGGVDVEDSENHTDDGFSVENLVADDNVVCDLGNVIAVVDSVSDEDMTSRERSRMRTIRNKVRELNGIVKERVETEIREREGLTDGGVDYDCDELFDAYQTAKTDHGAPYCAWSLFKDAYNGNAKQDFLAAVDDGAIEVYAQKDGIRMDGYWPRFNVGRLWLQQ